MKIIYYAAVALGFLISPVRAELKIDVNGAMRVPTSGMSLLTSSGL